MARRVQCEEQWSQGKGFMTGVLLGNTSEQSGDCSYELLGLIYYGYLVHAAPLGQVNLGKAGGSKDSDQ